MDACSLRYVGATRQIATHMGPFSEYITNEGESAESNARVLHADIDCRIPCRAGRIDRHVREREVTQHSLPEAKIVLLPFGERIFVGVVLGVLMLGRNLAFHYEALNNLRAGEDPRLNDDATGVVLEQRCLDQREVEMQAAVTLDEVDNVLRTVSRKASRSRSNRIRPPNALVAVFTLDNGYGK